MALRIVVTTFLIRDLEMKYLRVAVAVLLMLGVNAMASEGIMISHKVRAIFRLVQENKLRCAIMHMKQPYQEVELLEKIKKGSSF